MMGSRCGSERDSYKFADRSIFRSIWASHVRRMAAGPGDFDLFFSGLTLQMKDAISNSGKYNTCPELGRGK